MSNINIITSEAEGKRVRIYQSNTANTKYHMLIPDIPHWGALSIKRGLGNETFIVHMPHKLRYENGNVIPVPARYIGIVVREGIAIVAKEYKTKPGAGSADRIKEELSKYIVWARSKFLQV